MLVTALKGIDELNVNLKCLSCSNCGVIYSRQPVSRLSWMCPHIALAITENESEFVKIHPEFKPYIPFIRQHARSNTDHFLPNVSNIYNCNDVTIFQSQFDLERRSHEFLRIALDNKMYTLWLPGFEWCFNADEITDPLSESNKRRIERLIFDNVNVGLFYNLNRIVLANPEVTKSKKIGSSGLRFIGVNDGNQIDFQVSAIYKVSSQKIRLNLKISGWQRIKGSSVAYYDKATNSLDFKHKALTIFEEALLNWCNEITNYAKLISNVSIT
ncbi:hypothetical protein MN202_00170 [Rheinheimera muenzenbergensis]|uniref:PilZ domain-containing protein n=1 Tax=Rheinheimera muenzenbergensis TaxID=1193628 RepID=A0ABU8C131_9GAMM